jgi:hypothetical protein
VFENRSLDSVLGNRSQNVTQPATNDGKEPRPFTHDGGASAGQQVVECAAERAVMTPSSRTGGGGAPLSGHRCRSAPRWRPAHPRRGRGRVEGDLTAIEPPTMAATRTAGMSYQSVMAAGSRPWRTSRTMPPPRPAARRRAARSFGAPRGPRTGLPRPWRRRLRANCDASRRRIGLGAMSTSARWA